MAQQKTVTPLARAIFELQATQIRIAKRAGLAQSRLNQIVKGHVEANEKEKRAIARAINRPVAELFPPAEVTQP
jgi:transcriptional regulator with XRE-family HTH domain